MPRRTLMITAAAAAALALVAVLAGRDRPPLLPGDADHADTVNESRCLECHSHRSSEPRPREHPLRDDCYSCHADATGTLHRREGAPTELPGGWRDDPRLNPVAFR